MVDRISVFSPGAWMSSTQDVAKVVRDAAITGVEPVVEMWTGERVGMWTAFPETRPPHDEDAVFCVQCGRWFCEDECKSFTIRQRWGTVHGVRCPNGHDAESVANINPHFVQKSRETTTHEDRQHFMDSDPVWRP